MGTTTSSHLRFTTEGNGDVVDVTADVAHVVAEAGAQTSGVAVVFVPGATAAVTTMEHEPGNVLTSARFWTGLCRRARTTSTTA